MGSRSYSTSSVLAKMDENLLQFKTKLYGRTPLPPYVHPNEFKVRMTVRTADLNLSDAELLVAKEILGPRYDDVRKRVVMVSNKFDSRNDNKRYLVDVLETVVEESRKINAEESA